MVEYGNISLDRMVRAVEKVRERLLRATSTLDAAGIPYAVIGGNAVAAWVSRVDEAAVRNTRDVDILLRRDDLPRATKAMEAAGFVYRHARGIDMFLDGGGAKARDAVHIVFAGERIGDDALAAAPDIDLTDTSGGFHVLDLERLVTMKLTSYRDRDRTHLRDMIELGLIDDTWPARFPAALRDRLQQLLDDPNG